ncbi:hypothetical protein GCM10010512_42800 [Streptomyces thermoviolaceus subsp. thermoviolaceus]|nr:hypothetical protein GCM10010499_49000 [Streptomyces thermoviolaceus subsp. apingens]GHB06774.1 hypothetical protein GCM10010512_42800 [Streptomyces thermoviolaceus subsp. thermoviolaceus]
MRGAFRWIDAPAIIHADRNRVQLQAKFLVKVRETGKSNGERCPAAGRARCTDRRDSKEDAVPAVPNGVRASSLDVSWVKSRHSNATGNCVEIAALDGGGIAVRNSRDPDGPALIYTPAEMAAFLAGAKDGEFDHLV